MKKVIVILNIIAISTFSILAQTKVFTLEQTIAIASDSSLQAFVAKNLYLASYWQYKSYQAARLPSLSLITTPISYSNNFIKRYDSEQNIDVYRQQKSLYSSGNLALSQNIDLTGGTFSVNSQLGFMKNYGESNYKQFSAIPISITYQQALFGYNSFKWDKKIEPLKYETAKRNFLYKTEEISITCVQYFFDLASAQVEHLRAIENLTSADTLYQIGQKRSEIAAISKAELLTLKLDALNARNSLINAQTSLNKAMSALVTFLNLEKGTEIKLLLPEKQSIFQVSADFALQQSMTNNPTYLENKTGIMDAEKLVEKTSKELRFDASVYASVGYNNVAEKLKLAYQNTLRQDIISVGLNIPILDWGVKKGRLNVAKNNLNVIKISNKQEEIALEQDVVNTVQNFSIQQEVIKSAEEATKIADLAYQATRERFIIGENDISALTLSLNRQTEARRNYIEALKNYWLSYYKIRKLTLYDFEKQTSLLLSFDRLMKVRR
ncbi:outer membrane efflux protein [Paludibacter propionicigenes WB4]|uniref:Outer membrane efflux protein n=1 Tax=Paludibacter propionicigenes (strain DSM 17365 / JCM 13257 / WB4) TaxID=694427 RepID=E4T4Q7_PALPW|nr:TolC family protein [Paludibacter propionicigenes]ADQ79701.1 outer membrane efflux protein [Paludibacter propionicigenes WB4]